MSIISFDLGTGGLKASLYDDSFNNIHNVFEEYNTYYVGNNIHEQRPLDWYKAVIKASNSLKKFDENAFNNIKAIALSGASLVTVPIDKELKLLQDRVPIWSDTRAKEECKEFFSRVDEERWYNETGNGFPKACYSIFKLMHLKKHNKSKYNKIFKVLGSKDFINFKLTNAICTDYSYASGLGCFNLLEKKLDDDLIKAANIDKNIFPKIISSHDLVGTVTKQASLETGLKPGIPVYCGGVDNSCMALGMIGCDSGRVYTSLGSSSWIAVNTDKPIIDDKTKPFTFVAIEDDLYTSAYSIFAGGSSLNWARKVLYSEISDTKLAYLKMSKDASEIEVGSNSVFFNPSLAGGTNQDKSVNIRGAFINLNLSTSREVIVRSVMEGIALNLKESFKLIKSQTNIKNEVYFCGGGSKDLFWMQLFADIFGSRIIKTNVDQDAASLGAAMIAAKGIGLITNYEDINKKQTILHDFLPNEQNKKEYENISEQFNYISHTLSDLGDYLIKK